MSLIRASEIFIMLLMHVTLLVFIFSSNVSALVHA
jgi:hypothetical protein